jgi:hypothetical protein
LLGALASGSFLFGCSAPPAGVEDGGAVIDAPTTDAPTGHDAASDDTGARDASGGGDTGACATPDGDGDGYDSVACGGTDCDDTDSHRSPGLVEACDGADLDEDCDPTTFGHRDVDADGHFDARCCNVDGASVRHCGDDCDDSRNVVYPGDSEVCDGFDNDCDTAIDEGVGITFYADCDGDGFGAGAPLTLCTPSLCGGHEAVTPSGDCDDASTAFNPGANGTCALCPAPFQRTETCDGRDDDCNGLVDDGSLCPVAFGTGTCAAGACMVLGCDPSFHGCGAACLPDSSPSSCGTSCTPCAAAPANAHVTCDVATGCGWACNAGFAVIGAGCDIAPPRPVTPVSTGTVTSRRPTLRWVLGAGTDGATVDICSDRACATVVTTLTATGGASAIAPTSDLPTGVLFWRLHGRIGATSGVATSATWQFTVGRLSAAVDTSWGSTLDVNGDGIADVAVGAYQWTTSTGRVHVYVGGSGGLVTGTSTTLDGGDGTGAQFGISVSSAGDVNGDGFADLVVGAPGAMSTAGRVYVYLGSSSGLTSTPAILESPDGAGSRFGQVVAGAGDVNRDGYGDVAVAGFGGSPRSVYVFHGSASGLGATPATTVLGTDAIAVAGAGDVNGDGYDDIVIGDYDAGSFAGAAYVLRGGASGINSTTQRTLVDNATGNAQRFYGSAVACIGDVDGDGYADVAVGAPAWAVDALLSNASVGRVYVYRGGAGGIATSPSVNFQGPDGPQGSFGSALSGADLNGDGYSDLIASSPSTNSSQGRVRVYRGALGGPTVASATLIGTGTGSFGVSVAGAGDVNGDGLVDLAVGAYLLSSRTGAAYVFHGNAGTFVASPASTTIAGPDGTSASFGSVVASACDVVAPLRAIDQILGG